MQRVVGHTKAAARSRRYGQLFVAVLKIGLAGLNQVARRHLPAHCRAGAVRRQQRLHGNADEAVLPQVANGGGRGSEVGRFEAVLKEQPHAAASGGDLDQRLVETMPRD